MTLYFGVVAPAWKRPTMTRFLSEGLVGPSCGHWTTSWHLWEDPRGVKKQVCYWWAFCQSIMVHSWLKDLTIFNEFCSFYEMFNLRSPKPPKDSKLGKVTEDLRFSNSSNGQAKAPIRYVNQTSALLYLILLDGMLQRKRRKVLIGFEGFWHLFYLQARIRPRGHKHTGDSRRSRMAIIGWSTGV